MSFVSRQLLAGTALAAGFGLTATPASAACERFGPNVTCATTVTTDTTNVTEGLAIDRAYVLDLSSGNGSMTIVGTQTVSGYGLAATTQNAGSYALQVVNNGTVSVDPGNEPTAGGAAALQLVAEGGANLIYSGSGNVLNQGGSYADALSLSTIGTGYIDATIGGTIASTGSSSYGVSAFQLGAAGGNILINLLGSSSVRAGDIGVYASNNQSGSTGSITVNNAGSIRGIDNPVGPSRLGIYAYSDSLGAITVTNNGSIGAATDRFEQAVRAQIDNNASTAALTVSGNGTYFAFDTAIRTEHAGSGMTNVSTGTGLVLADNGSGVGTGIGTLAANGATNVSVGSGGITAAKTGVRSSSGTGAVTVNVGGQIAVGTATADSFGVNASSGSGAVTVNVAGGGGISGAGTGIRVGSSSLKTVEIAAGRSVTGTIGVATAFGGATNIVNRGTLGGTDAAIASILGANEGIAINNLAGATINGRLLLTDSADAVTNAGTWNVSGASDFAGGQDLVTNQAGGVLNIAASSQLARLETLSNAGTINALAGLTFTGAATTLANSGTLNLVGTLAFAGGGSLNNGGTINAVGGASAISGANVANSGTLNLKDGATNDTLTITGNFAGSTGSVLLVDFSQAASDRLVITGNATGVTQVVVTPTTGTARIDGTGLLLVDVGGTAAAGAFVTASALNPLINLAMQQRGSDFFLVALPTAAGFRPLAVSNLASDLWHEGADLVGSLAESERLDKPARLWIQGRVSRDRYGRKDTSVTAFGSPIDFSARQQSDRLALQAGADMAFGPATLGLTAGHQRGSAKFGGVEVVKAKGWNLGAYLAAGGTLGAYGSLLAKLDSNEVTLDRTLFTGLVGAPDSRSLGLDGTLGYRLGVGGGTTLDLSGGLALVRTRLDDFSAASIAYDFKDQTSLRGDIGARLGLGGGLGLHAEGRLFREFEGDTDLRLTSGASDTVRGRYRGTWGRLGLGVGGTAALPIFIKAHADVGDVRGASLAAGLAF